MIAEKSLLCVELAPCLSLYESQGGQFSICWLLAWDGLGLTKWMLYPGLGIWSRQGQAAVWQQMAFYPAAAAEKSAVTSWLPALLITGFYRGPGLT